ncbi:uncharacterized protein LOC106384389 [Brassica napus]|uniref:uncharacterized protein LOC106384389 n=1 Tax=Brassica napus TaxID=3708 RepID=UPI002078905A|nr:uncharacterized protein LOC106384389 [Brassica napus]
MVATWLMNSVSKNIGQSLLFMSTAESIWNNLMSRFKQDDAPRVFEIEQRLSTLSQGSLDVSAYYTELITLWEEYKNYIMLPVCTCGHCECNAVLLWEQLQQRGRVTKFLMGLNDTYEQTRRHILMLKPIPTIEEAFNIVAQDERQRNLKPVVQTDAVTLQTTGPAAAYIDSMEFAAAYNAYRPRGNRPLCTHCGQLGHTVAKCFKLHGYPPGYRPPSSGYQGQSYGASQRSFTPRGQHNYTPRSQIPPKTVAQMSSHADYIPYIPPPAVLATSLDVNQLNSSQLQSIIKQLQSRVQIPDTVAACITASITEKGVMDPQSSSGISLNISSNLRYQNHIFTFHHQCLSTLYNSLPKQSWIIDSGATSHVCADLSKFQEVFDASNLTVSLPNGTTFPILHTGTIRLSDSLVLYDVLHDLSQASMIGKGDVFNSLYILDLSASSPTALPADIWGPFSIEPVAGHKYFLTIVDDATRVTWVYMLRNKSDVSLSFPAFITLIQTQYNAQLKAIRTDNAPELQFNDIVLKYGLTHYFSCAYTPQQNSVVERKHQHLLNVARALMFQSQIPLPYWSDCVVTAAFLINRFPSPFLHNKSPYELLLNKIPDYSVLRAFGCLCYVSTYTKDHHKFIPRARASVFLGYLPGYKGYKVLDLETRSVSITRNVVFHETIFPLRNDSSPVFDFSLI